MQSLWMLVASALFAVLGACVKLAADRYHIAEIVLYRALTGIIALAGWTGMAIVIGSGALATRLAQQRPRSTTDQLHRKDIR